MIGLDIKMLVMLILKIPGPYFIPLAHFLIVIHSSHALNVCNKI